MNYKSLDLQSFIGRLFIFILVFLTLTTQYTQKIFAENMPIINRIGRNVSENERDVLGHSIQYRAPSMAKDGSLVAFISNDPVLVPNDDNGGDDIFIKNLITGQIERLAVGDNCYGYEVRSDFTFLMLSVSNNGDRIAFSTCASLLPEDNNELFDIYLYEPSTGYIELVSKTSDGIAAGNAENPNLSGDGRFVVYRTFINGVLPGDSNNSYDIYIYDSVFDSTERVSVDSNENGGSSHSFISRNQSLLSDDGRYIVFESESHFAPVNSQTFSSIYLRDRLQGTTALISKSSTGSSAIINSSNATITSDGSTIVFDSYDPNLVLTNPGSGAKSSYVFNKNTNSLIRINEPNDQKTEQPVISSNGHYVVISSGVSLYKISLFNGTVTKVINDIDPTLSEYTEFVNISADGELISFAARSDNIIPEEGTGGIFLGQFLQSTDTIPPLVMALPDRQPNINGWHNTDVTIDWQSTDPLPSSGTPSDPENSIAEMEGVGIVYTSGLSCDAAANCSRGNTSVSIDKTLPQSGFTGSTTIVRLFGNNIQGTAADGLSGVEFVSLRTSSVILTSDPGGGLSLTCNSGGINCTWVVTNSSQLPVGTNNYTITATDKAGNSFSTSKSYTVI